jgi:hypothetical protein
MCNKDAPKQPKEQIKKPLLIFNLEAWTLGKRQKQNTIYMEFRDVPRKYKKRYNSK